MQVKRQSRDHGVLTMPRAAHSAVELSKPKVQTKRSPHTPVACRAQGELPSQCWATAPSSRVRRAWGELGRVGERGVGGRAFDWGGGGGRLLSAARQA
jgi:hypothetical protein